MDQTFLDDLLEMGRQFQGRGIRVRFDTQELGDSADPGRERRQFLGLGSDAVKPFAGFQLLPRGSEVLSRFG